MARKKAASAVPKKPAESTPAALVQSDACWWLVTFYHSHYPTVPVLQRVVARDEQQAIARARVVLKRQHPHGTRVLSFCDARAELSPNYGDTPDATR
jgi:hypothetical protein